jgi:hypothetical protein
MRAPNALTGTKGHPVATGLAKCWAAEAARSKTQYGSRWSIVAPLWGPTPQRFRKRKPAYALKRRPL